MQATLNPLGVRPVGEDRLDERRDLRHDRLRSGVTRRHPLEDGADTPSTRWEVGGMNAVGFTPCFGFPRHHGSQIRCI
jgi:hypothetical protein